MSGMKKHIASYLLIGIFLLPNLLNITHFIWVDHNEQSNSYELSKVQIQTKKAEDHNCEQFFFKVPASNLLDLSYKEFGKSEVFYQSVSDRIFLIYYEQRENLNLFLRGPPNYSVSLINQFI